MASYQTEAEYKAAQQQAAAQSVTFNVVNVYGSIFGTQQHAEMNNVSFDFRTVQAELDRAEDEIERRGGPDETELKELIAEVRRHHESSEVSLQGCGSIGPHLALQAQAQWA